MTTTATPPPPPPVSYPPPPPPATVAAPAAPPAGGRGHLSGEKIGLIAGGGVAVIGGIVAVISLTGHHNPPKPPAPVPVTAPAQPTSTQPQNQPTAPPAQPSPVASQPSQPSPQSTEPSQPSPQSSEPSQPTSSQSGGGIDLGNGASLTPAAGWTVEGTDNHSVELLGPNHDAQYFAAGGTAKDQDAATQLQDDAQAYVSSDSALSNVKVGDVSNQQVSGSAGFTSVATLPFEATLTTNQGTAQIMGIFYELFDPQGYSVLAVYDATSEDAYRAGAQDADAMTSSILG